MVFSFQGSAQWGQCQVVVTSVLGHLIEIDFEDQYRSWKSCNPDNLFGASIKVVVPEKMETVRQNIVKEGSHADVLYIWTDCDREGEHIGWEIVSAAQQNNTSIVVKRAHFSNLERSHLIQAAQYPQEINMNLANEILMPI